MATRKTKEEMDIAPIQMGFIDCCVVSMTPLYMHRFSAKARQELLFPKGRANAAERASSLKHDPLKEFREATYLNRDPKEPAAFHLPQGMFGKALAAAALDLPGATKAKILRLVSIASPQINVFGIPRLSMEMVRSSDQGRTPDVRTRPVFPEWACNFKIGFVSSLLKPNQIANLLNAAGMIVGVGDWRPEKGGSFGKFRVCEAGDPDYVRILKTGGRLAQMVAYEKPIALDADSEELLTWFYQEAAKREKVVSTYGEPKTAAKAKMVAKPKSKKGNGEVSRHA